MKIDTTDASCRPAVSQGLESRLTVLGGRRCYVTSKRGCRIPGKLLLKVDWASKSKTIVFPEPVAPSTRTYASCCDVWALWETTTRSLVQSVWPGIERL